MTCTSRLIVIAVLAHSWSGTSAVNLALEPCQTFSYGDDQVSEWNKCWRACNGDNQSPINIDTQDVITESFPTLDGSFLRERHYDHSFVFREYEHTLLVQQTDPGDRLYLEGGPLIGRYRMSHLEFSWGSHLQNPWGEDLNMTVGSEHAIDGVRYPLEVRWTFYNEKYNGTKQHAALDEVVKHKDGIMMISVLLPYINCKEGNEMIYQLQVPIRQISESKWSYWGSLNYGPLFPEHSINDYYSYNGSRTKPPCSENAIWLVYLLDNGVDLNQLTSFWSMRDRKGRVENNFRQLQPLNGRQVVQSDKSSRVTGESTPDVCADSRRRNAGESRRHGAARRPGISGRHH